MRCVQRKCGLTVEDVADSVLGCRTDLESTFKINVAGVHYVTSALLPLLRKGSRKEIVNM